MEIKIKDEKEFVVELEGRLDTTTSPELDKALEAYKADKDLILDFTKLEYISSAGLRLLLAYKKKTDSAKVKEIIKNPNDVVSEVFNVTGFSKVLNIK